MTPSVEIEPEPHWWEASALTTTPPLLFTAQLDFTSNFHSYLVHALGILLAICQTGYTIILKTQMRNQNWK